MRERANLVAAVTLAAVVTYLNAAGLVRWNFLAQSGNQPPVITSPTGDVAAQEGELLVIPFSITEPNNDRVNYRVEHVVSGVVQPNLPAGAALFTDPRTAEKRLEWWPGMDQAGTYQLRFRAIDELGAEATPKDVTVTVGNRTGAPGIRFFLEPTYNTFQNLLPPYKVEAIPWESAVRVGMRAVDPENPLDPNEVTITMQGLPADAILWGGESYWRGAGTRAAIKWIPTDPNEGKIYTATMTATDRSGNKTMVPLTIDVRRWAHPDKIVHFFPSVQGQGIDVFYDSSNAIGHAVVKGTVTLGATTGHGGQGSIGQGTPPPADAKFQLILHRSDGSQTPIGPVLSAAQTFSYDTRQLSEGNYALSLQLIDGSTLDQYYAWAMAFIVDNDGRAELLPRKLPVTGRRGVYSYWFEPNSSSAIDWVMINGPTRKNVRPYPTQIVAPPQTDAERMKLRDADAWWPETTTQAYTLREDPPSVLYQTKGGHGVVGRIIFQGESCIEPGWCSSRGYAQRVVGFDGGRNDNMIHEGSVYTPNPSGPGFIGLGPTGRIFRVDPDGTVTTLAGPVMDRNVIPPHPADFNVPDAPPTMIGNFDAPFDNPRDLAFDALDPKVLYVADAGNHRIAKVDFHGTTPHISTYAGITSSSGFVDGQKLQAKFFFPMSLTVDPRDGAVYVSDTDNNAIRKIAPDGTVTTIVGKGPTANLDRGTVRQNINNEVARIGDEGWYLYSPASVSFAQASLYYPMMIRMDSQGNPTIAEGWAGALRRVNMGRGVVERIAVTKEPGPALTFDVDRRGNVGPIDDLLVITGRVSNGDEIWRFSRDGSYEKRAYLLDRIFLGKGDTRSIYGGGGDSFPMGGPGIDDQSASFIMGGHIRMSAVIWRPRQQGDPTWDAESGGHDSDAYVHGRTIYAVGTAAKFAYDAGDFLVPAGVPLSLRPSLMALHGAMGHSYIGNVPTFDDLALSKTNAEIAAYVRSGMGGNTPRPEIAGVDLRDLIYFIRQSSLEGKQKVIDLKQIERDLKAAGYWDDLDAPLPAPEIHDAKVEKINDTTYRVSWKTDQPTFGNVEHGPSDYYGLVTPIQGEGKVFTVTLTNVAANLHVRIRAKNEAGRFTVIQGLRPSGTFDDRVPPVISAVSVTGIAATTATVTWKTDEPADSQVEYGTTQSYGNTTTLHPSLVSSHAVDLNGLTRLTTYHYRVKSKDAAGNLSVSGDFTFTTTERANTPPTAAAGSDQTITLPATATLNGTTSDDGLPDPPAQVTTAWSKVSGPGAVTFGNAASAQTTANFSQDGTYVLRLTVSDSSLSAADDIQIIVKPAKVGGELRAYWKFDGDARDGAGANHGTLLAGASFAPGKMGQALSANGSAVAVRVPDADTLDVGKADLTIAGWVKFTAGNQYFDVLAKQGAFKSRGYRFGNGGTGPGKIEAYYNDGILEFQTRTSVAVNDGQWHHVASVVNRDGESESFLYVDGVDRTTRVGSMITDTLANTLDLVIGASYSGLIDELCLWDRGLSQQEVMLLKNGKGCDALNPPPPPPPPPGDSTPPVISNVRATTTVGSATITWNTDEPSDSQVEYGTTVSYGSSTTIDPTLVKDHTVVITGLTQGTLYHYRVKSKDAAGNPAVSGDVTFTTETPPPKDLCFMSELEFFKPNNNISEVAVKIMNQANSQVLFSGKAASNQQGKIFFNEDAFLQAKAGEKYAIFVKPIGFFQRVLKNVDLAVSLGGPCLNVGTHPFGDINRNSDGTYGDGKMDEADLLEAIRHYKTRQNAVLSELFGSNFKLRDLVRLIQNFVKRLGDEK